MQSFLFFFDKVSALILEILIIICSIIGISLTLYGLLYIPFYINKTIYFRIFASNIFLLSTIFIITLLFIIFRKLLLINKKLNTCCNYLSIVSISISLIGVIIDVIIDTFIINNMLFYDNKAKKNDNNIKLTSKQWGDTIFVIIFLFFIYLIIVFLGLSDNLRINLRIDDSYYKYQLAIEEEANMDKINKAQIKGAYIINNNGSKEKMKSKIIKNIIDAQIPDPGKI